MEADDTKKAKADKKAADKAAKKEKADKKAADKATKKAAAPKVEGKPADLTKTPDSPKPADNTKVEGKKVEAPKK
jgi:membrane protein involved in colicin uptake